jgi:hypothetical protein
MHDSQTKALMLGIAETYERIAKAYETNVLIDENPPRKTILIARSSYPMEGRVVAAGTKLFYGLYE